MSEKNKLNFTAEPAQHDVTMTREFDAPRELVFKALCDADVIRQWWGDASTVEAFDAKPGGSWSILSKNPNGWESRMRGVFHDVTPPERMIRTFEFMPGKVSLETTTLEDKNGRTNLVLHTVYQSVADRDGLMQYGLKTGAEGGYDRFESILKNYK